MGLSSNTIIHFTKNLSGLNSILTNNFNVRYCRETIYTKKSEFDLLLPMVSFCDIPFSQIINHVDNYGNYGIGLKKSWAEKNGLNPVLYIEKNSSIAENIFNHLFKNISSGKEKITDFNEKEKYMLDFLRYLKNYQGDLKRVGKKTVKDYRFSDEREWRYILDPNLATPLFGYIPAKTSDENIKSGKEKFNKQILGQKLAFMPDDINYIIIKKETERDDVIRKLEKINGKYPHEQVKRLTSRIISTEQLKTDF